MSLTKKKMEENGWTFLKQSPSYWSFFFVGEKKARLIVRALVPVKNGRVLGPNAPCSIFYYVNPYKSGKVVGTPIADIQEDAQYRTWPPALEELKAEGILALARSLFLKGHKYGELDREADVHYGPAAGGEEYDARKARHLRSAPDRPMSSRSFHEAMGGEPYVGEKLLFTDESGEIVERKIKTVMHKYPDGKWEVRDTQGDVHVVSAASRKNPEGKRVVAEWRHPRGKAWVVLIDNGDGTFSYRSDHLSRPGPAGGYMGKMSMGKALLEIEKKLEYLTPDAYKTELVRVR